VTIASGMLDAGLSFLLMFLLFRPLEWAFPAKVNQRCLRPQWWTDFCFMAGQNLFFNGAVLSLMARTEHWADTIRPAGMRLWIGGLSWWMQAILVVVAGDFLIYWGHRLQHRVPFLWRFHSIHHSAEHMDWLAAHREHPIDSLYAVLLVNLPAYAIGFPIKTLALFVGFRALWSIYLHANVRIPLGPLRLLIGAPELHHWHHDRSRDAGNYSNVSPLMDVIFGTYHRPNNEPVAFGVEEPMPAGYLRQLAHPFRRARIAAEPDGRAVTTQPTTVSVNA
jgi:sterol desaturase/sphingolipid hydroxylase (fatty acid hydroxylase superfamily)